MSTDVRDFCEHLASKSFVDVADKHFPRPCFINNLSNKANLNNFPVGVIILNYRYLFRNQSCNLLCRGSS